MARIGTPISVPDGKMTNVTSGLPVKFWNEDDDHPDTPPSYGSAGWTQDGKYVFSTIITTFGA